MICLRCGYCCQNCFVVIVDDPAKGIDPDNLKVIDNQTERCPHLQGDKPGEYSCAIHDEKWYPETPCFAHGQIEQSPDCECRMGRHILEQQDERE
jgi:hypothetical protein